MQASDINRTGNYGDTDLTTVFASQVLEDEPTLTRVLDGKPSCHSGLPAKYVCSECAGIFCGRCAGSIGSSGKAVCKSCGSLCLPFGEVKAKILLLADQRRPFGIPDFKLAVRLPLRAALTCFGLGVIYGATLFSLPFFNVATAGILLGSLGLLPAFLGNAMMFGCALRMVEHLQIGRTDCGEVFDVTPMLADIWDTARLGGAIVISLGWIYPVSSLAGLPLSISIALTVAWMVLTYPAVLAVAAVTSGFWSTVNPIMVISTILRLGPTYWSLFLTYIPIALVVFGAAALLALTLLPGGLNLPIYLAFGILSGPLVFYANMVIGGLVGRALFKRDEQF